MILPRVRWVMAATEERKGDTGVEKVPEGKLGMVGNPWERQGVVLEWLSG